MCTITRMEIGIPGYQLDMRLDAGVESQLGGLSDVHRSEFVVLLNSGLLISSLVSGHETCPTSSPAVFIRAAMSAYLRTY